jgi:hypothetical protein
LRVLTLRELNRATLARQLLLERKRLTAVRVVEHLVGMQAQSASAPYFGIWTRTVDFKRAQLERALRRGDVLRPTVMRGTLHFVSRRDYPMLWSALRDRHFGFGGAAIARAMPLVAEARARAPFTQREAFDWIGEPNPKHVLRAIRRFGHLVHAPETSLWQPTASLLFHAVEEPASLDKDEALAELAVRYLRAFGPATSADLASWSMIPAGWFAAALEPLAAYRNEDGRTLYDVPRGPLPGPDTPAPVRLLPKWDNAILGYEKSRRLLPADLRRVVIGSNGDVAATVLVDGSVAGTWQPQGGVEFLRPLTRTQKAEIDDEWRRLKEWLTAS